MPIFRNQWKTYQMLEENLSNVRGNPIKCYGKTYQMLWENLSNVMGKISKRGNLPTTSKIRGEISNLAESLPNFWENLINLGKSERN